MSNTATETPKPPKTAKPPVTGNTKVSLQDVRPAFHQPGDDATVINRYIIGRKTVGQASGLSAFLIDAKYEPDLTKLPDTGTVSLVVNTGGYVTGIRVEADL